MVNQRMIQNVQNEILDVDSVDPDPLKQFRKWFEDAHLAEIFQPEVMHLATRGPDGAPTGRFVLYKDPEKYGLDIDGFLFFTNLNSPKAVDIQKSSQIALTFYWKELLRQIRIKGTAERAPDEISDKYFEIRPDASKLGAWASSQSEVIDSRAALEEKVEYYRKKFEGKPIPRPKAWGGFVVHPNHLEFWQHRDDRLHDRVRYTLGEDGEWTIQRLSLCLPIHAARNYGCRVTTTTISEEQFAFAEKRIAKAGLSEKITVVLLDYRDLEGQFDKLVSVEMIEAVGEEYLDDYFGACSRLLKPEGLMAIQAIVMNDQHYDEYRKGVDFIQRYIFPGSCLPSTKRMLEATSRATDLRLTHMEDITPHYPRTLRAWRERFFERIEEVRALGFSDTFIRMWEFYLCYCEGGFLERYIGDVQLLFAKPLNRVETSLPDLTKDRGLAEI